MFKKIWTILRWPQSRNFPILNPKLNFLNTNYKNIELQHILKNIDRGTCVSFSNPKPLIFRLWTQSDIHDFAAIFKRYPLAVWENSKIFHDLPVFFKRHSLAILVKNSYSPFNIPIHKHKLLFSWCSIFFRRGPLISFSQKYVLFTFMCTYSLS